MTEKLDEGDSFFEVGIVGSGFGGSISAIELGKVFKELQKEGEPSPKICIVERGIWYLSPEAWVEPDNKVANYIRKTKRPYRFWAMPDSGKGLLRLITMMRKLPLSGHPISKLIEFMQIVFHVDINPNGLYDIKNFKEAYALVASGVGGGSLVYSNVTISPEPEILDDEYKEPSDKDASGSQVWKPKWKISYDQLEPYMMYAKHKFIGVSKIYSVQAGIYGEQMALPKVRELYNVVNKLKAQETGYDVNFEVADLSITESAEWDPAKKQYIKNTTKFCRRQGRCNFGCLPGARHSLNKKLVDAIESNLPIEIFDLMDVALIEPKDGGAAGYILHCNDLKNHKLRKIHVKVLILAAGTFGTTELILRSKERSKEDHREHDLADVNEEVGTRISLNGDAFGFVSPTENPVYSARGPIDAAHVRFKKLNPELNKHQHYFTIEDATIPRMVSTPFASAIQGNLAVVKRTKYAHVGTLARFFYRESPLLTILFKTLWANNNDAWKFFKATFSRVFIKIWKWNDTDYGSHAWMPDSKEHEYVHGSSMLREHESMINAHDHRALDELEHDYLFSRTFFFACMGIDRSAGKAKWNASKQKLEVDWQGLANDPIYSEIEAGMSRLGEEMVDKKIRENSPNKEYLVLKPMIQLFGQELKTRNEKGQKLGKMFALHPLGGCPMETQDNKGAIDTNGRLRKRDDSYYENLFVIDGSIVPTALGVNPSLTISGLTFMIIDKLIRRYRPAGPVLNSVQKDEIHNVTFREKGKSHSRVYTIGTVDPKDGKEFGNVVYVDGDHLKNIAVFEESENKGSVLIMQVNERIAYGKLVD